MLGGTLLIGASWDDGAVYLDDGSAYIFTHDTSGWVQRQKVVSSGPYLFEHFGNAVALTPSSILVGAYNDNAYGPSSGAFYAFPSACSGEAACLADLSNDGTIDASDLSLLLQAWGSAGANGPADLNADAVVNSLDLNLLVGQWGPC